MVHVWENTSFKFFIVVTMSLSSTGSQTNNSNILVTVKCVCEVCVPRRSLLCFFYCNSIYSSFEFSSLLTKARHDALIFNFPALDDGTHGV